MKVLLVANTGYNFYQFRLPVIRMLRAAGVELTLACPAGPFAERLKSEGIRVIEWEMRRRSLNPVRVVVSLLRLITIYRRERPNLVHHITIQANIYGSLAALVAGTGMVVNSWTGLGFVFSAARSAALMRAVLLPFMWLSMRRRRVWSIFLNEHDQERGLRMRFAHPNRVVIIPGEGVDTERFSPPLQRPQNERPKVLMIARLLWDKGIAEFREAAHMLNARGVAAEFLLAGGRDEANPSSVPAEWVKDVRHDDCFSYLGEREDIDTLLRAVNVVVLPSYHEGLPLALVEAAACGLPLVATDIAGCQSVVREGVNGFLVPVRDSGELADAIARLIQDPALQAQFGSSSRRIALDEFSVEGITAKYAAFYQSLGLFEAGQDKT